MLQHQAGHDAKSLQREFAYCVRQLSAVDVTSLGQPGLKELQRRQHEQERAFMKPRLPQADLVHQPIAAEFSHRSSPADHRSRLIPADATRCGARSLHNSRDERRVMPVRIA
jgi:hypothetical protein